MNDIIIFIVLGAFVCMMYRRSEKYARGVKYEVGSVGPDSHCGGADLDGARDEWSKPQTLTRCKEMCAYNDSCVGFNTATCPGEECKEQTNLCNFQGKECKMSRKAGSRWYPVTKAKKKNRIYFRR